MNRYIYILISLFFYFSAVKAQTLRPTLNSCASALTDALQGPKGDISSTARRAGGSTGGLWYQDEGGVQWFVKKDVNYNELQTSAEVISANVYRLFGYNTPETVKFVIGGVHYSASKDIGENSDWTNFSDLAQSETRQLRVVAAYLKDWDRLGNPSNNRLSPDGTFTLLDFGGTLGSRARGGHKPGRIFSAAIGSFEATEDLQVIYDSFGVQAADNHPWNRINRDDMSKVIEKFKQLSDEKIGLIVKMAGYSNPTDSDYMIRALKMRRDGIIRDLLSRAK